MTTPNRLYTHESFSRGHLIYSIQGSHQLPLVVFITGGGVLGRVAYGSPECDPKDFLNYWLAQKQYPFLALTYPMEHPIFSEINPEFSIDDWGRESAVLIKDKILSEGLKRKVLILGWSMSGRVAAKLSKYLKINEIEIEVFIGLCASLPSQSLLATIAQSIDQSSQNFAVTQLTAWLHQNLELQDQLAHKVIIPKEVFQKEFLGNYPVNLGASIFRLHEGRFIKSAAEDLEDSGAWNFEDFSLLGLITHQSQKDARHALLDIPAWTFYVSQVFFQQVVVPSFSSIHEKNWPLLLEIFDSLPQKLCLRIDHGGHFFFLGEQGARQTIGLMEQLVSNLRGLIATCDHLFNTLSNNR